MLYWFKCCLNSFFFSFTDFRYKKKNLTSSSTLFCILKWLKRCSCWNFIVMATEKQLIHRLILLQLCLFTRWRLKIRSQGDTSSLFDVWRLFVLLADVCRLDGRPSRPAVHPCNPRRVLVRYQNHLSWFPLTGGAPPSVLRPHSLQRKPSCRSTITDRSQANNQDNAFCCDHLQHHQTSRTFIFFLPSLDVIRCQSIMLQGAMYWEPLSMMITVEWSYSS